MKLLRSPELRIGKQTTYFPYLCNTACLSIIAVARDEGTQRTTRQAINRNYHFNRFARVARDVLDAETISEGSKSIFWTADHEDEVFETIRDLLDTPATVFLDDFFLLPF